MVSAMEILISRTLVHVLFFSFFLLSVAIQVDNIDASEILDIAYVRKAAQLLGVSLIFVL